MSKVKEFEYNSKTLAVIVSAVLHYFELSSNSLYEKKKLAKLVTARKFVVYFAGLYTTLSDTELANLMKIKNVSQISYYRDKIKAKIIVDNFCRIDQKMIRTLIKRKIATDIAPANQLIEIAEPMALRKSINEAVIMVGLTDEQVKKIKSILPNWDIVVYTQTLTLKN